MVIITFWLILIIVALVFLPPFFINWLIPETDKLFYEEYRKKLNPWVWWMFPAKSWVYAIIWTIMYGLITAAIVTYAISYEDQIVPPVTIADIIPSRDYLAIMSLLFINHIFNLLWSFFFFVKRWVWMCMIDSILLFGTGFAALILMGLDREWTPFGLYFAYVIWSFYAMILSVIWASMLYPVYIEHRKAKRTVVVERYSDQ